MRERAFAMHRGASHAQTARALAASFGLELIKEKLGNPSSYCYNQHSCLKQEYQCIFSVCRKVSEGSIKAEVPDLRAPLRK